MNVGDPIGVDVEAVLRKAEDAIRATHAAPEHAVREQMLRELDELDGRLSDIAKHVQATEKKLAARTQRVAQQDPSYLDEYRRNTAEMAERLVRAQYEVREQHVAAFVAQRKVMSHGRAPIVKRPAEDLPYVEDDWGWDWLRRVGSYIHPGWGVGLRRAWRGYMAAVRGTAAAVNFVVARPPLVIALCVVEFVAMTVVFDPSDKTLLLITAGLGLVGVLCSIWEKTR